jgi:Na+/H+ antiporter NhaD/arsenite permease-like protein
MLNTGFTHTAWGYAALAVFVLAYGVVIAEEFLHLRKAKPVVIAAGLVWVLVALAYGAQGEPERAHALFQETLLEYAELLLFLLAAMTYVNTIAERGVFDALRAWLVSRGLSFRALFWITGALAFFISPVADNLTTALIMGAVVLAVGGGERRFVVAGCINVVVAANAGGAFSPFGDVTTLMVWQKGVLEFGEFFVLFVPSLINWLVPAAFMSVSLPGTRPAPHTEQPVIKRGGLIVTALLFATIALAVLGHNLLHLPPVLGMMSGLGLLMLYSYRLRRGELRADPILPDALPEPLATRYKPRSKPFDIFISIKRAEWDTLLFFYGVMLCVGGLGALGYLSGLSELIYGTLGASVANVLVGIISAVVDNIPVMYAVLAMQPEMAEGQWLLATLTAGVGGSLLSIGSAAGVALMGQARGVYTFFAHLKWTPAIAAGYAASIAAHFWLNAAWF